MENLFLSSKFKADDLTSYCKKLDALGWAISALGFHEDNGGSETLTRKGEELGMIISDYAMVLHKALDSAYRVLNEFFECDSSLAYEVSRACDVIKSMRDHSMALEAIEKNLKLIESTSLDTVPTEDVMEVFKTRQQLLNIRAAMLEYQEMKEQKGAPAKADDNTEAPETDLKRSAVN